MEKRILTKTSFLDVLLCVILLCSNAAALNECFIGLDISETKIGENLGPNGEILSQEIEFELIGTKSLTGSYNSSVAKEWSESQSGYKLKVYNSVGQVLKDFSLPTSRFVFYDNFDDQSDLGGIVEFNEGIIATVIPFNEDIASIKLENNGIETPFPFDIGSFSCELDCIGETETGFWDVDTCCQGLMPVGNENESFVCVNCGDGVCSDNESFYSCFEDCSYSQSAAESIPVDSCSVLDEEDKTYYLSSDVVGLNLSGPCFTVTAPGVVFDCQGHSITSDDAVAGVYSDQDFTMVKNCVIDMGDSSEDGIGIFLEEAHFSAVLGNTLAGQYYGLYLLSTNNSRVAENQVSGNRRWETYFKGSSNNTIESNTIDGGEEGAMDFQKRSWGGITEGCNTNVVRNNHISNSDEAAIAFYFGQGNIIQSNTLESNSGGIQLYDNSNNNEITYNTSTQDMLAGIHASSGNIIAYNTVDGGNAGIYIMSDSEANSIEGNLVLNSKANGIEVWRCDAKNTIKNNIVSQSQQYGISLREGSNNDVIANLACGNSEADLYCENSSGNGGEDNMFGTVQPCGDGWPEDFEECTPEAQAFVENYGSAACLEPDWCDGYDLDNDGDVDVFDLQMFLASGEGGPIGEGDFILSYFVLSPSSVSSPGSFDVLLSVHNLSEEAGSAVADVSVLALDGSEKAFFSTSASIASGSSHEFVVPVSVPSSWEKGNYKVRVSVSSQGAEQAQATKFLSVSSETTHPIFSVPELGILLLPILMLVVLFLLYKKGKA